MKPTFLIIFSVLCLMHGVSYAQQSDNTNSDDRHIKAGVMIGTDIGGAIPVPLRYVPETFNPYPQLNLAIGAFAEVRLRPNWSLNANLFYKTVGMKADARVSNQKYEDTKLGLLQYYTGTAKMDMSFTMIEVPVYAKYIFNNQTSRVIFGAYFAYNLRAEFETLATNGYSGAKPDDVSVVISKHSSPMNMSFTGALRNFDAGLLAGYEHALFDRFSVGLRVSVGLYDIFQNNNKYFDYKMINMRGSVVLGYRIFN